MDVKKLFSFDGRVGRGAFWGTGLLMGIPGWIAWLLVFSEYGALVTLVSLAVAGLIVIASFANSVKRWHDRNKSGAWVFISFVPIIGPFWAIIETGFLAGTDGANQYGVPASGSPFGGESTSYDAAPIPSHASTSSQSREWGR